LFDHITAMFFLSDSYSETLTPWGHPFLYCQSLHPMPNLYEVYLCCEICYRASGVTKLTFSLIYSFLFTSTLNTLTYSQTCGVQAKDANILRKWQQAHSFHFFFTTIRSLILLHHHWRKIAVDLIILFRLCQTYIMDIWWTNIIYFSYTRLELFSFLHHITFLHPPPSKLFPENIFRNKRGSEKKIEIIYCER